MKTKITKALLAKANGAVKGLVLKDSSSPFSRVRLDVAGPNVSLTGSNGDMQIEYRVEGETGADGTLALPGGQLGRFVDAMPAGVVEIDGEAEKKVTISGGEGVTFRLAAASALDYPVMAGPKAGCGGIDVDAAALKEMLRKVKFAADTDGSDKACLCGVNVKLQGDKLEMTATDGRRLAHVEKDIGPGADCPKAPDNGVKGPEFDIILSNKTVNMLFALLGEGPVTIQADAKAARFTASDWIMTTKVFDGKYPEWQRAVPEKPEHTAKIDRGSFLVALGRAALATRDDNVVKVMLKDGLAKFEARNDLSAASAETVLCSIEGGAKTTFLFNYKLLKDALEAIDDDDFTLDFRDEGFGPVVLKCSIPWLAVVMPMRLAGKKEA